MHPSNDEWSIIVENLERELDHEKERTKDLGQALDENNQDHLVFMRRHLKLQKTCFDLAEYIRKKVLPVLDYSKEQKNECNS